MKRVTLILLTIDRYHLTREYIGKALRTAGHPFDLCIADNGSTDPEIFKWCEEQNPKIYHRNGYNAGTAQSINRMIRENPADFYCFIGNDIDLPPDWLKKMVDHATAIPESGMVGINWRPIEYEPIKVNDRVIWPSERVFGDVLFSQAVIDKLGALCQDYGTYGFWDSDMAIRCKRSGFINYYLAGEKSVHMGDDTTEKTPYRKMKDDSLKIHSPVFQANIRRYNETGEVYLQYVEEKGEREKAAEGPGLDNHKRAGTPELQSQAG